MPTNAYSVGHLTPYPGRETPDPHQSRSPPNALATGELYGSLDEA